MPNEARFHQCYRWIWTENFISWWSMHPSNFRLNYRRLISCHNSFKLIRPEIIFSFDYQCGEAVCFETVARCVRNRKLRTLRVNSRCWRDLKCWTMLTLLNVCSELLMLLSSEWKIESDNASLRMFGIDSDCLVGRWSQSFEINLILPNTSKISFYHQLNISFYRFSWSKW